MVLLVGFSVALSFGVTSVNKYGSSIYTIITVVLVIAMARGIYTAYQKHIEIDVAREAVTKGLWDINTVKAMPFFEKAKEPDADTAADTLLKYKQLLDAGAITQEEFDQKKKELLGEKTE